MIHFIQKITFLLVLFSSTFLVAQDFQGEVYYKSKTKMREGSKERMDSLKIPDDRKKMMQEMIKKMLNKSYILTFNKTTSIYKEEEKLEQPNAGGISFKMSSGIVYKDVSKKSYTSKQENFGKVFLIKDSLKKIDWKLEKESKKIGNYLAFKATALVEYKERFGRPRRGKESKTDSITIKKPKMKKLTVWYTPEIPISNGPELYQGLPGLILELNIGRTQLIATKIVLNPKEKITIEEPKKGKVVSQAEYDKIMEKKIEELRELRRGRRDKRPGGGRRHMFFGN